MIASHIDFLLKMVTPAKKIDPLRDDADYRLVDGENREARTESEMLAVVLLATDEEYRPTYELVRQNKMPESETMLARLLNAMFGEGKKGAVRTQQDRWPPIARLRVVRRYLGTRRAANHQRAGRLVLQRLYAGQVISARGVPRARPVLYCVILLWHNALRCTVPNRLVIRLTTSGPAIDILSRPLPF